MVMSPNTQAILLLTAYFSKAHKEWPKPLTPTEWGRFASWLKEMSLTPESLMTGHLNFLNGWSDNVITPKRIEALMDRGSAMALAVEKWFRAGLWIITQSNSEYPLRLKERLGFVSPALLFGCGRKNLLNGRNLAVIGSRKTTEQNLDYSEKLGAIAADNGYSIVSGGARGIDEAAMLGALKVEGTAIGVLADNLLRVCSSVKYRNYLMEKNLVLVSPFYPEAGFNVGNAMQRNKYIYSLADAAVVVHSGNKGGTWSGAKENLRRGWVPLRVKKTSDRDSGNAALVEAGAEWISGNITEINFKAIVSPTKSEVNLQGKEAKKNSEHGIKSLPGQQNDSEANLKSGEKGVNVFAQTEGSTGITEKSILRSSSSDDLEFYELFLKKIHVLCADSAKTVDELADALKLQKAQLKIWLKQAVDEKKLKKTLGPVKYLWKNSQQQTLFVDSMTKTASPK